MQLKKALTIAYLGPLCTANPEHNRRDLFGQPTFEEKVQSGIKRGLKFSGYTYRHYLSTVDVPLFGDLDPEATDPIEAETSYQRVWLFRRKCYQVENILLCGFPPDEIPLRIKHAIYKQEKALEKIQKEVAAFENFERLPSARRERIPESVRLFVWQRDGGRCVKCELKERLEFDHIIPVAEGGSSTERNVQLLCETCNRKKGKAV